MWAARLSRLPRLLQLLRAEGLEQQAAVPSRAAWPGGGGAAGAAASSRPKTMLPLRSMAEASRGRSQRQGHGSLGCPCGTASIPRLQPEERWQARTPRLPPRSLGGPPFAPALPLPLQLLLPQGAAHCRLAMETSIALESSPTVSDARLLCGGGGLSA